MVGSATPPCTPPVSTHVRGDRWLPPSYTSTPHDAPLEVIVVSTKNFPPPVEDVLMFRNETDDKGLEHETDRIVKRVYYTWEIPFCDANLAAQHLAKMVARILECHPKEHITRCSMHQYFAHPYGADPLTTWRFWTETTKVEEE